MNKILCLILFFLSITSAYAANRGYVWIPATGYYDAANFADERVSHKTPYFQNLPLVNSKIELKANNKIFFNYKTIEFIHESFMKKLKTQECGRWKATFTSYFLSLEKDTTCDVKLDLQEWVKQTSLYSFKKVDSLYSSLHKDAYVRVLGYVQFKGLVFAYVEVIKN